MTRVLVAAVTVACSGCWGVSSPAHSTFTPVSVTTSSIRPVVRLAMLVYKNDLETLRIAGAEPLGSIVVSGIDSTSPEAMLAEAKRAGAAAGGTHIFKGETASKSLGYTTTSSPYYSSSRESHMYVTKYAVLRVPDPRKLPRYLDPRLHQGPPKRKNKRSGLSRVQ